MSATSVSPRAEVYRTWRQYLESKHGLYRSNNQLPSPLWSTAEQAEFVVYDPALSFVPDSASTDVLSIEPISPDSQAYKIVTRFSRPGQAGPGACSDTMMTLTTFATRGRDGWRLAGALSRLTESWRQESVGAITFVVDPTLTFNPDRAKRAAAFIDSTAALLGVGSPPPLSYYVASSFDVVCEIQGIRRVRQFGPVGGISAPWNRQVFSGNPAIGEGYFHELAHALVYPLNKGASTMFAVEGVATWLGGTAGQDFLSLKGQLAKHLEAHPASTLDSLMSGPYPVELEGGGSAEYVAGAVLSEMVFERAGTAGLRVLLGATTSVQLRSELEKALAQSWDSIQSDWRLRLIKTGLGG
jgi:hypothetical protein